MKEQYQPTEEEVKKAEEMMSDEEKEMSEERETTYEAGGHKKHEAFMEMSDGEYSFKKKMKKIAAEAGLSQEIEDLFVNGEFSQFESQGGHPNAQIDEICPSKRVTEEQILKVIEELPKLNTYAYCSNPAGFTKPVMKKLLEKFTDVKFCCSQGRDDRLTQDMYEVLKELGQDKRAERYQD